MAKHSSILTWRIPWTEDPGGLWPIGSQRVEDGQDEAHTQPICLFQDPHGFRAQNWRGVMVCFFTSLNSTPCNKRDPIPLQGPSFPRFPRICHPSIYLPLTEADTPNGQGALVPKSPCYRGSTVWWTSTEDGDCLGVKCDPPRCCVTSGKIMHLSVPLFLHL